MSGRIIFAALALAGCSPSDTPQERRYRQMISCQQLGGNPLECVEAIDRIGNSA